MKATKAMKVILIFFNDEKIKDVFPKKSKQQAQKSGFSNSHASTNTHVMPPDCPSCNKPMKKKNGFYCPNGCKKKMNMVKK